MRDHRFPIIAAFVTFLLLARSAEAVEFAGGTGEPNYPYSDRHGRATHGYGSG